jgi:hypothetical protein
MKVIVSYTGFNPEFEEELYFATRRRPDQAGEQIVDKQPTAQRSDYIATSQQHEHRRVLTYDLETEQAARAFVARIEGAPVPLTIITVPELGLIDEMVPVEDATPNVEKVLEGVLPVAEEKANPDVESAQ